MSSKTTKFCFAFAAVPIVGFAQRAPVILPLTRRYGEISYGSTDVMRSHFVATVSLGIGDQREQQLDIVFDTSSGQVILPAKGCTDQACKQRTLYNPEETNAQVVTDTPYGDSVTADLDMVDFDRGLTNAYFVSDTMCFGSATDFKGKKTKACLDMTVMAATQYTDKPWLQLPYDGVIGLGLDGLSVMSSFNFLSSWKDASDGDCEGGTCPASSYAHQFAFHFPASQEGDGDLAVGGYVADRLDSPLVWVPVDTPEDGYWLIRLTGISIGKNKIEDACPKNTCWGLIDTSCSRLGVPKDMFPELFRKMALTTPDDGDCRGATGPDLRISVHGMKDDLTLRASDYGVLAQDRCVPEIVPLRAMPRANVYVLGEGFLRRYYTVFDWKEKKIGFGLAKSS